MRVNIKDVVSGLIFVAIGAAFCALAVSHLALGTSFRMGPGYFPTLAGGLVILLGVIIVLGGLGHEGTPFGAVPWRGMILTCLSPIVFGICIRGLGLGPTIVVSSLITCFASYKVGIVKAVLITTVLTAFCLLVFHTGLGLPIRVIGPWLQFR